MAWLTVPGTNIDGPVQQGPDNDYYLRRDSDGNEDYRGCYFADADAIVSLANLSRNLVIYGHTFTDGWDGGFAQLDRYLDADWALEHTDIQVEIGGTAADLRSVQAWAIAIQKKPVCLFTAIWMTKHIAI